MAVDQQPKILRRFKSDRKCRVSLGSFDVPFRQKRDKNNPEAFEPFRVAFISTEDKIGDELIKQCELTVDENFRIPDHIPGFIVETNPDGTTTKHSVGGMKVADYLPLTWEFRNGYLREDKEFHELSRLKFLEHESAADKAKMKANEERIKKLEAELATKKEVTPAKVEKKVSGKVKGEIR